MSNPSAGINKGPADSSTPLGSNYKNYSGQMPMPPASDVLPGMAVTSSERVPFNPGTNLSGPLAPKQIGYGITRDEMNKRQGQFHDSIETATKKTATLMDPAVTPYIDNATASAFKSVHDSAAMQQIYSDSIKKVGEVSGVNSDLAKNANVLGKPTGAHAKYAKTIQDSNKINTASRRLVSANQNFYDVVAEQCPMYTDNQICKEFKELQNVLVNEDFETMILKNLDFREKITEQIEINNDRKMAIMRMKELLGDRLQELSGLEKKINKLDTEINVNTRSNYYKSMVKTSNRDWQSYILFVYYEIFLVYILISNFIPEENYMKILPLFLILLYLFFPLIMKYSTIIMQNLIIKLQQLLGSYPLHVKTIN